MGEGMSEGMRGGELVGNRIKVLVVVVGPGLALNFLEIRRCPLKSFHY